MAYIHPAHLFSTDMWIWRVIADVRKCFAGLHRRAVLGSAALVIPLHSGAALLDSTSDSLCRMLFAQARKRKRGQAKRYSYKPLSGETGLKSSGHHDPEHLLRLRC